MAAFTEGLLGGRNNPFTAQASLATALGLTGTHDTWFHDRVDTMNDPSRLLVMKHRRLNPFWHVLLSRFPKKSHTDMQFSWDEQEYVPTKFTPESNADVNTIKMGTTNYVYVQEGDELSIDGIYWGKTAAGQSFWASSKTNSGTIGTTAYVARMPETVRVVSRNIATGDLTVVRGIGGTTAASPAVEVSPAATGGFAVAPIAITTTHKVFPALPVTPEIANGRKGFRRNPERKYGALQQVFSDSWSTTRIESSTKFLTGKPIDKARREARYAFMKKIDRTFLVTGRLRGVERESAHGSAVKQSEYASTSIIETIPSANYLSYGNKIISYQAFSEFIAPIFDVGSRTKWAFMPRNLFREFGYAMEQKVVFNGEWSYNFGLPIGQFTTLNGDTLMLVEEPEAEEFTAFNNSMIVVDFGDDMGMDSTNPDPLIQYMYLEGEDIQIIDDPDVALTEKDKQLYYGVIGLRVAYAETHFVLDGFRSRVA